MKRCFYILFACACALIGFVHNATAQLANGDIITISRSNYFLTLNESGNGFQNKVSVLNGESISRSLWRVTSVTNGDKTTYSFSNVEDPSKSVRINATYSSRRWNVTLAVATDNPSGFTLEEGRLYYTATYEGYGGQQTANCYIRCGNNGNWTANIEANNEANLTFEKWEYVNDPGGIKVTANPDVVTFDDFISDNSTIETHDIKLTVGRTKQREFYRNLNDSAQEIVISEQKGDVESLEIKDVSASWNSNGNNNVYSGTTCQIFGESAAMKHSLLEITNVTPSADKKSCTVSIRTVGKSPMEMNDGSKWKDYSDVLVVAFRDADINIDGTYRAYVDVTRHSFHQEELPEFEVEIEPSTIEFSRYGGTTTTKVTCTHQHGYTIRHMFGNIADNKSDKELEPILTINETFNATPSIVTFEAQKKENLTASEWLTVVGLSNDGILTLSAPNNDATKRHANLVGVFSYTNPLDATDTHTKTVVLDVSQRIKDGNLVLLPNKGHSGAALVKNKYTGADEQQVHTVEKTIYYTPDQTEIELRLAETNFRGYMRWYDYQTGCNPESNKNAVDRTSWQTAPRANNTNFIEINPPTTGDADSYGNSYGLYFTNNRGTITNPNIPKLEGWADGSKMHIIACDVSAHKDYTIGDDEIIEPTLSYRQLFYLRPATEIAEKFKAAANRTEGSQFLENYEYTAPSGRTVMLSTQFRYKSFNKPRASHSSEFCYYYYTNGTSGELGQVGVTGGATAKWYKVNGATPTEVNNPTYPTFDYLEIEGQAADTEVEYQLIVPGVHGGKDLKIARFVVKFVNVNTHGPVNNIKTQAEIADEYQILEYNNFNYGATPTTGSSIEYLNKPLPWGESTYGFFYSPNEFDACDRQNTNIPYYGEYALLNTITPANKSWAGGSQHGGADEGFALFVDGTTEPGLVASISTAAEICSGQTLYCSLWLMNPRKNNQGGTPPVFRCNIQGRDRGDSEWKDVGVYYVGALANNDQNWKQVVFEVNSAESYDEARVQIYNFGTDGDGNDFFMDDLCLYASPLPLAAYHATTGCQSYTHEETTNTVVVLRIDYNYLNDDTKNKYVYYEVYNETDKQTVQLQEKVGEEWKSIYYQEDKTQNSTSFGSILIPQNQGDSEIPIKDNITTFINELTPPAGSTSRSGTCFVQDEGGKLFLYLVHVIPTGNNVSGSDANVYLDRDKSYILRISNDHTQLHNAACVFTTQLHATQDTYVQLHNDEVDSLRITSCLNDLCANNHHFLTVKVQNTIMPTVGGAMKTIEAQVHADWLMGFDFDDIYCNESAITSDAQKIANDAFVAKYGHKRDDIEDAIAAMRNTSPDNPNYQVDNAKNLQVLDDHLTEEQRDLIVDLCNKGLLLLYQKTKMFYLGSKATARFWVYPVAEDAEVTYEGKTYILHDCNEPKWVKLTSVESEYGVNLSPIRGEDQDPQQKLDIASIRILEGTKTVRIPVKELTASTQLSDVLSPTRDIVTFDYDIPTEHVLEYVDLSNNRIDIVDAPSELVAGEEYLMRMAFYDQDGNEYIGGIPTNCRVGYIYFYLTVVPKTVQWTGDASNIWGDDGNWKGVKADGTLMDIGYAPLPESNVIIRKFDDVSKPYPVVLTDDHYPMDVYHHPNACNKIYIEHGAMIHNQHLLEYNQAFVDMKISAANWNSMAPPLKGMYTGDMFVPHNGMYDGTTAGKDAEYRSVSDHSEYPFAISPFKGNRTSKAPYVFWQSIYNKRATIYHENGNQSHPALTESAIFAQTNSLGQALPVGSGFQVLGFGPTHGTEDEILVRLPKPDDYYNYYYSNGTPSDQRAYVEHSSKLAFEPDANGDMYITLTNDLPSSQFMFGNPTMTNIDMQKFLDDPYNKAKLAQKYYTMSNSSWKAETWATAEQSGSGELAPMRSVLLELASGEAKSITVKLSKTHLVGYTEPAPAGLVARKMAAEESGETQLMTIYATSEGGQARCMLASNAYAHDIYSSEEDALFISSGVEEGVNSATATSPVNMYTVSDQVPMMVDVREKIDTVPLSMLVHDSYRSEKVKFAFYLSLNWDKECYFCDAVTGERYRIMDGLWLELDMPQNHEVRYFIDGPDVIDPDNGGDIWSSTEDVKTNTNQVWAYSPSQGQLVVASNDIIKAVMVYDIAGRLIGHRELEMQYNSTTFDTPTGACIVKAVLRDNTEHYISALVK